MSSKRDFHDLSDDDDGASNGEKGILQEDSRFSAISQKRRRLTSDDPDVDDDQSENEATQEKDPNPGQEALQDDEKPSASRRSNKKLKPLTTSQLAAAERKAKKTGVVYISRVPPFMKPATVRKLLEPYGDIGRIFLTPEPAAVHQKRVRAGGNKKKSFVDGWVEFTSKKNAKHCVDLLNGNTIGGKKGGFYHDDIWNLKYLKGFKWSDLMEQVQIEERMREGRLRAELQREAKERKAFLNNLDFEQRVQARNRKEEAAAGESGPQLKGTEDSRPQNARPQRPTFERRFRQNEVKDKSKGQSLQTDGVQRVLRSIF